MNKGNRFLMPGWTALAICAAALAQTPEAPGKEKPSDIVAAPQQEEMDAIASQVASMDLRVRVAQLMLVTLEGRGAPDAEDRVLLENYTPGGVIVRMLSRPEEASAFAASLRPFGARLGIPLWVGTDLFMAGRGERSMHSAFMQLPSPLALAATNDPAAARFLADVVAEYLAAMGFNLCLGPALELAPVVPGAEGSIISLGSSPTFIAEVGRAFVEALGERGIAALPMGFPGGGANQEEKMPPVLVTPKSRLAATDLLPFARAIEGGAKMLHVGPVLVPTIDAVDRPACLSAVVIKDLLRGELGFKGVVVAGPLDAPHLATNYDAAEAAAQALEAGADMLYWNEAGARVMRVVDRLVAAVEAGQLRESVVDAALRRVLTLKRDAAIASREAPKKNAAEKLNKDKDFAAEAARWELRSITLVRNSNQTLPLSKNHGTPVGVTGVFGVRELTEILAKRVKSIVMQPLVTATHVGAISDFEIERATSRLGAMNTVVCLLSEDMRPAGAAELVHALKRKGARVVAVLLGYPKMLPQLAEADAILLAYCHESSFAKTLDALADILLGKAPVALEAPAEEFRAQPGAPLAFNIRDFARSPAGRLPVALGENYPAGLAASYSPADTVKRAAWDFGDGKRMKGDKVAHAYAQAGRYPLTISVTDTKGGESSRVVYVIVE